MFMMTLVWSLTSTFYNSLNTHIHAIARPHIWENYENVLFEGGLYLIKNIYVRDAADYHRSVTNSKIIHILPCTVDTLYEHDNFMIPFPKFKLKSLGDLRGIVFGYSPEDVPVHSIGKILSWFTRIQVVSYISISYIVNSTYVISVLEDLQPIRTIQTRDGLKDVVKFRVNDGK